MEPFASGPLSRKSRRERISYWPDPRNAVTRGLNALLDGEGESGLTPQNVADASVAAQGLPALERLLFSQDGSSSAPDALSARECAVGQAISLNLRTIAADALAEWSEPEVGDFAKIRATLAMPDKAVEAASAVLGDVATGLRVMEDRKIPPLFGGKGVIPDEKKAESWRSHRSARDLLLNVEALQAALEAIAPFAPEAAAAANEKLADAAAALADPNDPNRGVNVIAAINNAKYYVVDVLPGELGVALGFNSLDGD
jgi:predicted lipoprotein